MTITDFDWFKEGKKDISAAELMIDALIQMNMSVFDELVRLDGASVALAAVKPHRYLNAAFLVESARKKMNCQGNGPDVMLLTHVLASVVSVPPCYIQGEIKERGAEGINRNCVFKNGSPELCISISHYYTEGAVKYINPEYEVVWTHHETGGDPYCRYVFKKRSDPISVVDDLGRTVFKLPPMEVPEEDALAARVWGPSSFLDGTTKAFVDLHGVESSREFLTANAERIGRSLGRMVRSTKPEIVNDISQTANLVRSMQNALGQKDLGLVEAKDGYSNIITDCSQQVFIGELCRQYEALFRGLVNAINPEFKLAYDKMISQGEKACQWTITRRADVETVQDP